MDAPLTKRCFKCGEIKPLSEFYKHPQMADGHVNKCKCCNKKDVHKNREDNLEYIQEYDRNRRKKCNVSEDRWEELSSQRSAYQKAYYEQHPEKLEALRARYLKANVTEAEWQEHLLSGRKESFEPTKWLEKLELRRDYMKRNPDKVYDSCKRYREENPKKYKAHSKVGHAIKSGKLVAGTCEVCGSEIVHGHHYDYDKPLEVMWLCPEHHLEWHRLNGEGLNAT